MLLDDAVRFANIVLQQEAVQRECERSRDDGVKRVIMVAGERLEVAKFNILKKYIRSTSADTEKYNIYTLGQDLLLEKYRIAGEIKSELKGQNLNLSDAAIKIGTLPETLANVATDNFTCYSLASMQMWLDKLKG